MRAAGIRRYSDPVQPMELPGPGDLRPDEVLIEVRSAGVGNWDEIARTGGWDLGRQPPMALGVEVAGVVAQAGAGDQGRWRERGGDYLACPVEAVGPLTGRHAGHWSTRSSAARARSTSSRLL